MFRLAFAIALIFLLWLASLFTDTAHQMRGDTHIYSYNWVGWTLLLLIGATLVGFAEIARRWMKDGLLAILCLCLIPLFGLPGLQLYFSLVEVSPDVLVHRREPPHTSYNVDLPWNSILSATKIVRERPGLFAPNFHDVGYEFTLRDGGVQKLPVNALLTGAQREIDAILAAREIPLITQRIPLDP